MLRSSIGELNNQSFELRDNPALAAPLAYTIDFPFGTLAVTDAAHDAYGLAPQQDINIGSDRTFLHDVMPVASGPDARPRINILLAAAHEAPRGPDNPNGLALGARITRVISQRHALHIVTASTLDRDTVSLGMDMEFGAVAERRGMDYEALLNAEIPIEDDVEGDDPAGPPMTMREIRDEMITDRLVSAFATSATELLPDGMVHWRRADYNLQHLRRRRQVLIGTTALGLLLNVANALEPAQWWVGGLTGVLITGGLVAYTDASRMALDARLREVAWAANANDTANNVSNAILATFLRPDSPIRQGLRPDED